MPDDQKHEELDFLAPPPFTYDGVVREASYTMRHVLASWESQLGVRAPTAGKEDRARFEHAELQTAISHAKNVLRSLAARRDALADSLLLVTAPRVDDATRRLTDADRAAARKVIADDDDGA